MLSSELSGGTSLDRRHWTRIFSVALFVEHVLLGVETRVPELRSLVTEFVFLLDKVGARGRQGAEAPEHSLTAGPFAFRLRRCSLKCTGPGRSG